MIVMVLTSCGVLRQNHNAATLGERNREESPESKSLIPPVKPLAGLTQCDAGCLPLRATRSINMHKAVFRMVPPRLALIFQAAGVKVLRGLVAYKFSIGYVTHNMFCLTSRYSPYTDSAPVYSSRIRTIFCCAPSAPALMLRTEFS